LYEIRKIKNVQIKFCLTITIQSLKVKFIDFEGVSTLRSQPGFPVAQCRQLKQIAEAIYEALPQTPILFLSQKEAKKLLKRKGFAFCGK